MPPVALQQSNKQTLGKPVSNGERKNLPEMSEKEPHDHIYDSESLLFSGLEENFCRNLNPDHYPVAWCLTTDPHVRFEACAVPFCDEEP
jgi:hypothetical protein